MSMPISYHINDTNKNRNPSLENGLKSKINNKVYKKSST